MKRIYVLILFFLILQSCGSALKKTVKNTNQSALNSVKSINDISTQLKKPPKLAKNFIWGINGHPLTSPDYKGEDNVNLQFKLLKALEKPMYRFNIKTDDDGKFTIWKQDQPNWDLILEKAKIEKIAILPVLQFNPIEKNITTATAFKKGKQKSYGFAKKYGDYIDYYELGNELDLVIIKKNKDGSKKEDYHFDQLLLIASYLKGMHQGIKEADPSAKTIINCAGDRRWGFFELLKDQDVSYDILGWHWYSNNGSFKEPFKSNKGGENVLEEIYKRFKKPIWITEINQSKGTFKNSKEEQAAWTKQFIDALEGYDYVEAFMFYELFYQPHLDDNVGYENQVEAYFGLVDPNTNFPISTNPAFKTLAFKIEESKYAAEDYITHLYLKLHNIKPSQQEINKWKDVWVENNIGTFLMAFLSLEKGAALPTSKKELIQSQYKNLLGIEADAENEKYWLKEMEKGLTPTNFQNLILVSKMFYNNAILEGYKKRIPQ